MYVAGRISITTVIFDLIGLSLQRSRKRKEQHEEKKNTKWNYGSGSDTCCILHGINDVSINMKRYSQNEINELVEILKNDGVISVPTDTVFGVCARYDHQAAQDKLREVKNRPSTKAFPIMCANLDQIKMIAKVDDREEKLIKAFMPGPITLVMQKKDDVEEFVNGGMDTIAIRMATSKPLEQLIDTLGVPIYMTSANQSGQPVCTNLDEIETQCPKLDAMMIGEVNYGEASTIVDCTQDDIVILRQGPITLEDIQKVLQ